MDKRLKTVNTKVKFPENRKIKDKLMRGDRAALAKDTGLKRNTINFMMNGYRRFTPDVENAIIRLFDERKQRQDALELIANQ